MSEYPRTHSSPSSPAGSAVPVSGSTTLWVIPGSDRPNVPRRDSGSGSYWSHSVCELHISVIPSDVELISGGRRSGGTRSGMLVRTTDERSRAAYDGCSDIVV